MRKMNLRQYWDCVGTENIRLVTERTGSSMAYMRLLKYGIKKPGAGISLKLIEAARELTPGFEPDMELLLRGSPRADNSTARGRTIPPSAEFLASQKQ